MEVTNHKKKYLDYIKSEEWLNLKLDIIQLRGCRCEKCGKPKEPNKLQLHHITYERLFNERAEDLKLLCPRCHQKEHKLPPKRKSRIKANNVHKVRLKAKNYGYLSWKDYNNALQWAKEKDNRIKNKYRGKIDKD